MAYLRDLTPGIYWTPTKFLVTSTPTWEELTLEGIADENSSVLSAKHIAIVTGENDEERKSFYVAIPEVEIGKERELTRFDSTKKYGTIYQWHFFLAYKDIINALTTRLNEASKLAVEEGSATIEYDHDFQGTVWTTTQYNNGGNNPDIAIQWAADLTYESARLQFKQDVALELEITTFDYETIDTEGEKYTGIDSLKPYAGAYYAETTLPNVNTVYYPLKAINNWNSKNAKIIIVNTRQTGDRASFCVYIQAIEKIYSGSWGSENKRTLTKYQWQMFFAYSNLIDILYQDVNERYVKPGELSIYGLPGMIWTSSDYICKPNSLGAAEVSNGNGLKWVVCPAFRSSHIVLKTKSEYNFPTVGPVNDLL